MRKLVYQVSGRNHSLYTRKYRNTEKIKNHQIVGASNGLFQTVGKTKKKEFLKDEDNF